MSPASRKIRLIMELRRNGLSDTRVLGTMELMPRELFAPESFRDQAYENATLPIACHQTMSAPIVVGLMTQALELGERMKVLEIGTGSGYQAAILSRLCRRVYTIERYRDLLKEAERRFAKLGITNITSKRILPLTGCWRDRRSGPTGPEGTPAHTAHRCARCRCNTICLSSVEDRGLGL